MKQIWIIAKRELKSFFDSLMAYVMIILFLGFSGFFTWIFGGDIFMVNQASLQSFFGITYWTLFFFIPAITMGMLSDERKSGTIELLVTKPVTDWQIIFGKFLAAFLLICITLVMTLPYYITVASIGNIDHAAVWLGYLGLLFMSAAYISIGLYSSSITSNQIVAFLVALFIGIFFHLIFGLLADSTTGWIAGILNYLSLTTHYESMARGVIDSKDLIYFLSVIFLGLTGADLALRSRKTKKSTSFILALGILILVNVLSDRFFVRLDFTADKRYTLSQATKNILGSLEQPVTVTAYISEELPPQFAQLRRDFKEELVEYSNRSGGKVVFEFIDPAKDEQVQQKAMQAGIQPVLINVRDKDQVKQQRAYMGAVLQYGDKKEVIPFIQPGAAMEYSLSTSIKTMSVKEKPTIGIIQGNGEPSPNAMFQAMQALSLRNNIEPVSISDSVINLSKYKVVVMVGPTDSLPPVAFRNLDDYLASGGDLYIAINRVLGDLQRATGSEVTTGLERWLEGKGIRVNGDFVVDQKCGTVMVQQQQGFMNFQTPVNFPYLPNITNFADHPATKGLTSIVLPFVSSIDYTGPADGPLFISLVMSSERSGSERPPVYFDINRNWQQTDFPSSGLTVAALLSGNLVGNAASRIMVVADADFMINGEGNQRREIGPDNLNLFVNGIEWLGDDTGLIDLRTKEVTSRPLDQLKDGTRAFLKYFNFLLPVILIILYGIGRWQYRNNLRTKRMNENYF